MLRGLAALPQHRLIPIEILFLWHYYYFFQVSTLPDINIKRLTQQLLVKLIGKCNVLVGNTFCGRIACRRCIRFLDGDENAGIRALYDYLNVVLRRVEARPASYCSAVTNESWSYKVLLPPRDQVEEAIRARYLSVLDEGALLQTLDGQNPEDGQEMGGRELHRPQDCQRQARGAHQMARPPAEERHLEAGGGDGRVRRRGEHLFIFAEGSRAAIHLDSSNAPGRKRRRSGATSAEDHPPAAEPAADSPPEPAPSPAEPQDELTDEEEAFNDPKPGELVPSKEDQNAHPSYRFNPDEWPTDLSRWDE